MTSRSFAARLARIEALDRAHQLRAAPAYACLHQRDWEAYTDLATPPDLRGAIAEAYDLTDHQKLYVNCCLCWSDAEHCRVCSDEPFVGAV